ncbi:unnamed protein product [Brachionus calyciflorus]|uniref:Uncharacterized protein n=1 Tax=Brachionus calyciflorus TaxID=104777 RepID=A0A813XP58_9BILA|nr:unnamed protein product [Brachionus calyciflorus]
MFKTLKTHYSTIKVGDGRPLKVHGIGDIHSQINLKGQLKKIKIKDVFFVPDLSVNLISIGKLSQKGYQIIFDKESCRIMFKDVLMARDFCESFTLGKSTKSLKSVVCSLDTANFLRNRSPSSALNGKSPFEVFYGVLPKLTHFRVFGCEAYPLNLNNHREKFEPVAKRNCIGYADSDGIYWIYDKKNHNMFRSRGLRFNEKE